jgi:hypothetical protein
LFFAAQGLRKIGIVDPKIFSSFRRLVMILAKILNQFQVLIMSILQIFQVFLRVLEGIFGSLLFILNDLLSVLACLQGLSKFNNILL